MGEFLKSATRFYWAATLFGAGQIASAISEGGADRAARALDSVTGATEAELAGALKRAFRVGDQLQRGLFDLALGMFSLDALTSRGMMRATLNVVRQSAGALGQLVPGGEAGLALQEFQNKLQVFDLFEHVDQVLRVAPKADLPLCDLTARASRLDSFLAVWATEGVGHYYAEAAWERRGCPRGLLRGGAGLSVPSKGLAALHAGMGLSLANRLLAAVGERGRERPAAHDLRGTLRRFVSLCGDNSRAGYVGAAYEALGLVARNLYPHLVAPVDRCLSEMGDDLVGYFWHGVGRALYFAPTNYLPLCGGSRRAAEMARREPPHELGRLNASSGVAWALLLVNLRQPEIIEQFLKQCGDTPLEADAFASGMASAAVVWRDSTGGDDPHLEALCRHRPETAHPELAERWDRLVRVPCRRALNEYHDALMRRDCIGEVFRHQSLAALAGSLPPRASTISGAQAGRA